MRVFNRIRKVLLEQLKIKSYVLYAVGEILLIVVGVIIAIQLNNLNQIRLDKQIEKTILFNLKRDFQNNQTKIDSALLDLENIKKAQELRIRLSGPNATQPDSSLIEVINKVDFIGLHAVYGGDVDAMTPEQTLILSDDELKLEINRFNTQFETYKSLENEIDALVITAHQFHQKYVSILSEDSDVIAEHNIFPSDYQGWLRDREAQNNSVEIKWKTRLAIEELNKLRMQNEQIIALL